MWTPGRLKTAAIGLVLVMLLSLLLISSPDNTTTTSFLSPAGLRIECLPEDGFPGFPDVGREFVKKKKIENGVESLWGGLMNHPAQCSPARHVFFLKTHKCASTTVQNIFLRYGYKHNLTFALPSGGNYLGNPQPFHNGMLSKRLVPPDGKVDLFVMHTRLNPIQHSLVLHNDTYWVTIVRDPAQLYESLFNFFHMNNAYGVHLSDFVHRSIQELMALPRYGGKFGRNQMLFDFGYPDNVSVIDLRRAIDDLDSEFQLVMISELMDESLILLRHLLCWTQHDIVVFTKNARRQEVKPKMDPSLLQTLRELNSADVLLYDHFMSRHHEAVHKFGLQRMADEVAELRSLRDEYYEDCGAREVQGRDEALRFKEYSGLVSGYVTNNNTDTNCQMLSMPELPLVATIRNHQKSLLGVTP